jgi:hypothetical protein
MLVDITFSEHDVFLDYLSSGTLKIEIRKLSIIIILWIAHILFLKHT